jgi:hypothetical protein
MMRNKGYAIKIVRNMMQRSTSARKQLLTSQDWLTRELGMSCSPSTRPGDTMSCLFQLRLREEMISASLN